MINKSQFKIDTHKFHQKKQDKSLIILTDTKRLYNNHYINGLELSNTSPHFLIERGGELNQLFEPFYYSDFFLSEDINKLGIVIALQNAGWLEYNLKNDVFFNWALDIVNKNEIFDGQRYKQKKYWHTYTKQQYDSLCVLINYLIDKFNIDRDGIFHSFTANEVDYIDFDGIVCESNFDSNATSVSPAFDFKYLKELLKID